MLNKKEFKDVFDAHFDAIRSFVFYRCGDMETASDIAQDVFMKVWEKRESLNGSHITPLLYKMATDCYISHYRKGLCGMNFEQSLARDGDVDNSPEDELLFKETAAIYAEALGQMPEMRRTVFLMNREDGMKYGEIAERLHISIKTVEKHISAALRFLKTKLL
jgi:RNA polymerase sigma-70 factor (ECF subfamily)